MNKIKIFNEQERVKIELDFENSEVARQYFTDEECINDIVGQLDYDKKEETRQEEDPAIKAVKDELRTLISKAPTSILVEIQEILNHEFGKHG